MAEDDKARFLKDKELEPQAESSSVPKPKVSKKKAVVKDEVQVPAPVVEDGKVKTKGKAKVGASKVKPDADTPKDDKPKKQLNGYIKYLNSKRTVYRADNPSFDSKRVTKELAEQWGKLSDAEKQTWKES